MIKIDEYGISADNYGYVVGVVRTKKIIKDGVESEVEYIANGCYPTTIKDAVRTILKKKQLELVQSTDMSLNTLLQGLDSLQQRFESILQQAIKE